MSQSLTNQVKVDLGDLVSFRRTNQAEQEPVGCQEEKTAANEAQTDGYVQN